MEVTGFGYCCWEEAAVLCPSSWRKLYQLHCCSLEITHTNEDAATSRITRKNAASESLWVNSTLNF